MFALALGSYGDSEIVLFNKLLPKLKPDMLVLEYFMDGDPQAQPLHRLVTRVLDEGVASAQELAQVYHERWEIESTRQEMKTHLRGARVVLRSKTPDLVR